MKNKWLVFSTGFALFSMFFGSGNLVFPIIVGQESGGHYLAASWGILMTGVLVPFLGVFGMLLHRGDLNSFFKCFGKQGIFLFSLAALSLMGPFGVLARCLTVAHGALLLLFPQASLAITSFLLCAVIYLMTVNKSKIVPMLGSLLTPFLLLSIAAIVVLGINNVSFPPATSSNDWEAFSNGFFQGYQTMDLLASFFFSTFIIQHLHQHVSAANSEVNVLKVFLKASFIGAGILSVIYGALVMMGWLYAPLLEGKPPQEMLGLIAIESLGAFAAPCVCFAVVFACVTTAIVLASLFANFLKTEVSRDKISYPVALVLTLSIGFFVSNLDFSGIASFLGPILESVYPALIVLTIVNIGIKLWKRESLTEGCSQNSIG